MKQFFKVSILLLVALVTGFFYGYLVHRNKLFPYSLIKKANLYNIYRKSMQWTIGIYEGPSPFSLIDPEDIKNPVVSASDVTDVSAAFVADPFIVKNDEKYYMFYEVLNLDTNTGDIGFAFSDDGNKWEYKKIVLDEDFHLSYPAVYKWNDHFYMIPESSEDSSVRIYKAISFPEQWEYAGNLISGVKLYDPSLFSRHNKWWMFTSGPGNGFLNLYFSDSLTAGWQAHPMNPLIVNNPHIARPAGSVFEFENRLYRLAQDDEPDYGIQVFAVEITELSDTSYKENIDSATLVVSMTGKGWNAAGMHHVDLHKEGNIWRAVVDGLKRRP